MFSSSCYASSYCSHVNQQKYIFSSDISILRACSWTWRCFFFIIKYACFIYICSDSCYLPLKCKHFNRAAGTKAVVICCGIAAFYLLFWYGRDIIKSQCTPWKPLGISCHLIRAGILIKLPSMRCFITLWSLKCYHVSREWVILQCLAAIEPVPFCSSVNSKTKHLVSSCYG